MMLVVSKELLESQHRHRGKPMAVSFLAYHNGSDCHISKQRLMCNEKLAELEKNDACAVMDPPNTCMLLYTTVLSTSGDTHLGGDGFDTVRTFHGYLKIYESRIRHSSILVKIFLSYEQRIVDRLAESFKRDMFEVLLTSGDTHYGKWCCSLPFVTTTSDGPCKEVLLSKLSWLLVLQVNNEIGHARKKGHELIKELQIIPTQMKIMNYDGSIPDSPSLLANNVDPVVRRFVKVQSADEA
ncbi:hypothetical protein Tco_1186520 [Tanacetum coccineum]